MYLIRKVCVALYITSIDQYIKWAIAIALVKPLRNAGNCAIKKVHPRLRGMLVTNWPAPTWTTNTPVNSVADPDLHLDPDPHQSDKLDPDPDPHQLQMTSRKNV
jgi:hypothetical protein